MVHQPMNLTASARQTRLEAALASVAEEFGLPVSYPPDAEDEAREAVDGLELPREDATGVAFVTIDPPGSTDLDQAVHIERDGDGYTVRYAIADVPAFIRPGGALDAETRRRGQTLYLPQGKVPLHPDSIGSDAGSLLPGAKRGAYVWTFGLGADGAVRSTGLRRATVASRERLTYAQAQSAIDTGTAAETLHLLREVGLKRIEQEQRRGGATLRLPEQEVEVARGGRYRLVARAPLPVEDWNAQISLMTGMEAARIMLEADVGILRTMPPPDADALATFRRQAKALGKPWPRNTPYGAFLRSLDVAQPQQMALMHAATSLFRGAGYTAFDGGAPAETLQAAIGAPYAHATAPLRRLVDRFVLLVCEHAANGRPVPEDVRAALPELPGLMQSSNAVASRVEGAVFDAVETALLADRVGEVFDAVTVAGPRPEQAERARGEGRGPFGTLQLKIPAISARYEGGTPAGMAVRAELVEADIDRRHLLFRIVEERGEQNGANGNGANGNGP